MTKTVTERSNDNGTRTEATRKASRTFWNVNLTLLFMTG